MSKTDIKAVAAIKAPQDEPLTGCVVCGSYQGDLSQNAGKPRWHAACGTARPDVIAKVKARA